MLKLSVLSESTEQGTKVVICVPWALFGFTQRKQKIFKNSDSSIGVETQKHDYTPDCYNIVIFANS